MRNILLLFSIISLSFSCSIEERPILASPEKGDLVGGDSTGGSGNDGPGSNDNANVNFIDLNGDLDNLTLNQENFNNVFRAQEGKVFCSFLFKGLESTGTDHRVETGFFLDVGSELYPGTLYDQSQLNTFSYSYQYSDQGTGYRSVYFTTLNSLFLSFSELNSERAVGSLVISGRNDAGELVNHQYDFELENLDGNGLTQW